MINDLATEATTVHSRFPSAVLGFIVVIPAPCLPAGSLANALIGTLTRLGGRTLVDEASHRAEALSLILWDPTTGQVSPTVPDPTSPLSGGTVQRADRADLPRPVPGTATTC